MEEVWRVSRHTVASSVPGYLESWVWRESRDGDYALTPWENYKKLRSEISELRDYAKCYIENNEALQEENAELRARVDDLECEIRDLYEREL